MRKRIKRWISGLLAAAFLAAGFPVATQAASFEVDFSTYCDALLLINQDTGITVYEKNADKRLEPASMTKVMTYLVVCDQVEDLENTYTTISQNVITELLGTGSSVSGVIAGEELSIYELLNLMMVPSGNDAALALAEYVGDGDTQKFVDLMNEKAQELGCQDTHFMNPHGLHDEQHYTTARDMAIITQAAMKEPYFMEITNQVYYTLRATNKSSQPRTVYTTNRMINQNADGGQYYYRYCRGIKTGSHDEAGYCVVTTAVREDLGYSYLCVAMHCPEYTESGEFNVHGEMIDSKNLYQWAFSNLSLKTILESGSVVGEVGLEYAWEKDTVQVLASESFSTILPDSVDASSIVVKTELPETIEAPVKKGTVLGTATLSYAGEELTTVDLVAAETVERSELLYTMDQAKAVLTSQWFLITAAVIGALFLIYLFLLILYRRKKKKLRRVKGMRRM